MVRGVVVDKAPPIAEIEGVERIVNVACAVGGILGDGVPLRIVDALAGILDVEDFVTERAQAQKVHQGTPGHPAERVPGDNPGDQDLHPSACSNSSTVSGSSSDCPTFKRAHIRRYS